METITFKCPEKLAGRLRSELKGRKISKSSLLREALEFYLGQRGLKSHTSLYSLSEDLCGAISGPEDLSENSSYLEGYGL